MKKHYLSSLIRVFFCSLFLFFFAVKSNACDGSGFTINGLIDNGDGTFTLDVTIHIAGSDHPGGTFGGTQGFWFNTNAPGGIVSVTPASLTSVNGTTLNTVVNGGQVEWGNPTSGPFFVSNTDPTQTFNIQVVVMGEPSSWTGGGQEVGNCDQNDNNGAGPEYSGCFPPSIMILPVVAACAGQPLNVSAITTGGNVTVNWSNGMSGNDIVIFPQASFTLVATANNGCQPAQASIFIQVNPMPSIDPLMPVEVCAGQPVSLNAVTQNADLVTWSTGAVGNTNVYTPPFTEFVTVTATNQCGSVDEMVEVTVIPEPILFVIEGDQTICQGEEVLIEVEALDATDFSWSNGEPFQAIFVSPDETTTYTASASNQCGDDETEVTITVIPLPELDIPLDTYIICEGEEVTLTATGTNADMVSWSNSDVGESITVMPTSTQIFTATASNQCGSESGDITVQVNPYPTLVPLSSDQSICEGDSTTLSINIIDTDAILWSDGSTTPDITVMPDSTSSYTVTASNSCGDVMHTYNVDVLYPPDLMVTDDSEDICEGESATMAITPYAADTVYWSNGVNDSTITVSPIMPTDYTVTVENVCGIIDTTFSVGVTLLPVVDLLDAGNDLCEGESTSLSVNVANEDNFSWNNSETTDTINISPLTTTTYTATATNICGSDEESVTINVFEVYDTDLELSSCAGDTIYYLGTPLLAGESQTFTLSSINGCDSVVNVMIQSVDTYETDQELRACTGSSVFYEGVELFPGDEQDFQLTSLSGCDSIVTVNVMELFHAFSDLDLQACTGETVDYNGNTLNPGDTTSFVYTALNGCDSTVTVMVEELLIFASSLELEACTGTTVDYEGTALNPGETMDFTFSAFNGCDSTVTVNVVELPIYDMDIAFIACPDESITYNGTDIAAGTSQSFTFTTFQGCDSVVNVTVNPLPTFTSTLTLEACTGTTIDYHGSTLSPGDTTDFTLSAFNGCDSVVTVIVEELPLAYSSMELEACTGTTVDYNGATLSPGDTMNFTFTAFNGCDSILTITVAELPLFASDLELDACTGTTVDYNGTTLDPGAQQSFTLTALNGCDSTVNVTVIELPVFESDLALQACTGFTTTYNGTVLAPGDEQDFTLAAMNGCDSVVHVTVEEVTTLESELTLRTCPGSTINYDGTDLSVGEIEDFTFVSETGCDSIVTVTVSPYATYDEAIELQACTGTTADYNGNTLLPGDTTDFLFSTINGCDSLVRVAVLELEVYEAPLMLEACPGSSVFYDGVELAAGAQQSFTFTADNGCDSTINVEVIVLPTFESDLELQACIGSTTTYNGVELSPGDQQSFTLSAFNGCDSIVNVSVEGIDIYETDLGLEACTGTTITYDGTVLQPGTNQTFTFTSQIGCDSLVYVSVEELFHASSSLNLQACEGTTITYNGTVLAPGDQQDFVFAAVNGCDSTVSVQIIGVENLTTSEPQTICAGDSIEIFGEMITIAGSYSETYTSAQGCDSTHTVNLVVSPLPAISVEEEAACPDEENGIATLTANNGQAPYFYLWDDGNTLNHRDDLGFGSYTISVTDALGCMQTDIIGIDQHTLEYSPQANDISCYGANDGLIQINAQGSGLTYSLDGLNYTSSNTFTGLGPGTYNATIEDAFGCHYEAPGIVVEEPEELVVFLPEDEVIQVGDSVFVNAQSNGGDDLSYIWSPSDIINCDGCAAPYAQPLFTTYLSVMVQDSSNCTAEDRMLIIVERDRNVYIPNIFSPNGDGSNDFFYIYADPGVINIRQFYIFNRWGEPVFEIFNILPNDPTKGWDGYFRGELMNSAVFTYMAELEFVDGEVILYSGDVVLMR